jgi:hypothetical protein
VGDFQVATGGGFWVAVRGISVKTEIVVRMNSKHFVWAIF